MEELRGGADVVLKKIMRQAAAERASDVHIEPGASFVRVRFRKDGLLSDRFCLSSSMAPNLSVRVKVLGRLDVGESRLPQDGSWAEEIDGVPYDFRISVLPSMYGETIVIRILSGRVNFIEKNELGMRPPQEALFRRALAKGQGLILTTGPTGSGKTSTLYAALKLLNQETVSIISIEDPVEYRLPGVTQIQVNERSGLSFARGLRSLVRQDPDIVMIGEIRDRETAEIAIHASLTGHLVLSTLHTMSAAAAPLRLMDMGIPPYLLSASLSLVMAQRLVPRLCPSCKREVVLTEDLLTAHALPRSLAGQVAYERAGCEACRHRGFSGRTGVFEMIAIGDSERRILHHDFSQEKLQQAMRKAGQKTMGESALLLMEAGEISPESAAVILAGEA